MNYILDDKGKPIPEPDLLTRAHWFEKAERQVCKDIVGDSTISTVFLGIDHSFQPGTPILWETMVFGGALDQEQDRCSGSREQAEAMHARMIDKVKGAL